MPSQHTVLDSTTLNRISTYARRVNKPLITIVADAINEWMDEWGDPILDELDARERRSAMLSDKALSKKKPRNDAQKLTSISASSRFAPHRPNMEAMAEIFVSDAS